MFKKPIPCIEYPEYFEIPYFPNYCINKKGDVISKLQKRSLVFYKTQPEQNNYKNITQGYYITTCKNWLGKEIRASRHRLMALAFCKYNSDPDKLVCNHINGVPGDDRPENLELITRRQNLLHALDHNLMPNSVVPVEILFYENNEIKKFDSVAKAAKYLNCSHGRLTKRILTPWKRYSDGYSVKKADGTHTMA